MFPTFCDNTVLAAESAMKMKSPVSDVTTSSLVFEGSEINSSSSISVCIFFPSSFLHMQTYDPYLIVVWAIV